MSESKDVHQYDDIIHLPHHQSSIRPCMSNYDRAAQFSPFAALTGHEAAIKETARLTDRKVEIDEYTKEDLNDKTFIPIEQISEIESELFQGLEFNERGALWIRRD